jgi:probable HAF family extracellular repeat protein
MIRTLKRSARTLCLFGAVLLLSPATLRAQTSFVSYDFPGAVSTSGSGVNNRGDIVGWYVGTDGQDHGFLLRRGRFSAIDAPDSIRTRAFAINDRGEIVGVYRTADGVDHGFLLSHGTFTTIDGPDAEETFAFGINARGDIVGGFETEEGDFAFVLKDGALEIVEVPVEGAETPAANSINARGDIVGRYVDALSANHGFLLKRNDHDDDDGFTSIDFPGAAFTTAVGVNNRRQIVGSYVIGVTRHGFLFSRGTYSSIDVPGANFTNARGINDRGDIVGEYRDSTNRVHGFVLKR